MVGHDDRLSAKGTGNTSASTWTRWPLREILCFLPPSYAWSVARSAINSVSTVSARLSDNCPLTAACYETASTSSTNSSGKLFWDMAATSPANKTKGSSYLTHRELRGKIGAPIPCHSLQGETGLVLFTAVRAATLSFAAAVFFSIQSGMLFALLYSRQLPQLPNQNSHLKLKRACLAQSSKPS